MEIISYTVLDLGSRWRFEAPAALTPGKCPPYPSHRGYAVPQIPSGFYEEQNLLPLPGIEPRKFSPQAAVIPTELSVLPLLYASILNTEKHSYPDKDNCIFCKLQTASQKANKCHLQSQIQANN
jgi:hypothetical protein